MTSTLEQQLDLFISRFLATQQEVTGGLPRIEADPEWPSPCLRDAPDGDNTQPWQPTRQAQPATLFDGLENALETQIHPDLRTYYGRYWSDPLPARSTDGALSLLFVWNEADYERLRGNLVGHALAKIKQKQPLTLFFACTEPEDYVISLENHSGRVLLERPGYPPLRELAPTLAEFIAGLEPLPIK